MIFCALGGQAEENEDAAVTDLARCQPFAGVAGRGGAAVFALPHTTLGADLRRQATGVCRLIMRAYHDRHDSARQVKRLMIAIDDLKLLIQLGKALKAFRSFAEFQQWAELVVSLGKQSGGWLRQLKVV